MAKSKDTGLVSVREHIRNKDFAPVYLFFGEEDFLKEYYFKTIRDTICEGPMADFNCISFEGGECDLKEISMALDTPPMMADKKVIAFKHSGIFKKASEEEKKFWLDALENIDSETCVLFYEDEADKRSVLYKAASKCGICAECNYLEGTELKNWIARGVSEAGMKISSKAADYLIANCDKGMNTIKRELEKLFSYCEGQIYESDIDKIVTRLPQSRVFDMINAIMNKDSKSAFEKLYEMKVLNESPNMIVINMENKFMQLLKTKILLESAQPPSKIAAEIKVPPFFVNDYIKMSEKFTKKFLVDSCRRCSEMVYEMNSGLADKWTEIEKFTANCLI